jgi:anti-sigma factor RsiW
MLIPNHPDDERLSALASGDTDATADASLSEHLSTCARCTGLVDELRALRMSLAELPDLRPHRPLRLLPEVVDKPAAIDRLGGWARRVFAPVLTAGAALAMVGLIGTAVPALDNFAAAPAGGSPETNMTRDHALEAAPSTMAAPGAEGFGGASTAESEVAMPLQSETDAPAGVEDGTDDEREALTDTTAERSPWPMVLFAGVALMVAAALLRWILAPRAG